METIIANTPAETETAGLNLACTLQAGAVIAFIGGLGAGKTTFIRGLARGLGVTVAVTSPTYTIVNEYEAAGGGTALFHFDMYRLQNADELFEIGWDDYCARGAVIAVEWSERIADALPFDTLFVQIDKLDKSRRAITITRETP